MVLCGLFGTEALPIAWKTKEQAVQLQKELTGKTGIVSKLETNRKTEDRPLLFDLTELQRESNRRFGYTAQETLSIAQSLYERHKLITYPRTDSRYLTADMKPLIPQLIQKTAAVFPESKPFVQQILQKKLPLDKRIINDSKVSDHHAIIVTNHIHQYQPQKLTLRENQVLKLIMVRMLTALSGKNNTMKANWKSRWTHKKDIFKATGRIIVEKKAGRW